MDDRTDRRKPRFYVEDETLSVAALEADRARGGFGWGLSQDISGAA
jgi:hypothetical protein